MILCVVDGPRSRYVQRPVEVVLIKNGPYLDAGAQRRNEAGTVTRKVAEGVI